MRFVLALTLVTLTALTALPRPASAVDGVSVTEHFEGPVYWTIGGFGSIWRHDIINSEVVCRRKLHDGPGRNAVLNHAGRQVAFVKQGTGRITVMSIGGDQVCEVATAHEGATLDWPNDDTIYYNFGSWDTGGSRNLYKVDVNTGDSQLVVQWDDTIWRFGISNDERRAVARPTSGPADGSIVTYDLPGDGTFDPARATDAPSCGTTISPRGQYFVDGMHWHQGLDIRDWNTLDLVQSFTHVDATAWGGPDSGTDHNRNGWSVNSQDWICAHIGWDISPYKSVPPKGGNQVLYSWKVGQEDRIVVTPNAIDSEAYDSSGDFWVGTPPIPASTGLKAYWLFDSGDLAGDAAGTHTLINSGAVAGAGRVNGAAEFVAAESDEMRIPDADLADGTPWKLANGRTEMTVVGWFKKNRAGELEYLLQKGTYGQESNSFGLYLKAGSGSGKDDFCAELGRFPHNAYGVSEQAAHLCWPDAVSPNAWYFFAVTLDANRAVRMRIWDDLAGQWLAPDMTWTLTEPPVFTGADLVLGCGEQGGTVQCFDGSLDDLQLYDVAMTATEIDDLVTPVDCAGQGFACCSAGDICTDIRTGGGCASGAVCCASSTVCAPPACGDGFCSSGETCDLDACCDGRRYDGADTVCCSGVFTPGECCISDDCLASEVCTGNICVAPRITPMAHWALEAGALNEDSIGNNTLVNDGAGEATGKRGGAAVFVDGGMDMLRIADSALDPGMPLKSAGGVSEFTVVGWFNRDRSNRYEYLLQKGGQTEQKLSLGLYFGSGGGNRDELCVEIGQSSGADTQDSCFSVPVVTQNWYFFAVSLDTAALLQIRLYDDQAGAWLSPTAIATLNNPINIEDGALHMAHGEWSGNDRWFVGRLDEIRIFDVALSPEQIEAIRARDASGPNEAPIVDAGADKTNIFRSTVVGVDGSVVDPNGDPFTVGWTLLSGPAPAVIATPDSVITMVTFDTPGDYVFELAADDGDLRGADEVMVSAVATSSIALTSPVGGEVWQVGDVHTIEWTANGISDVAIRYSTDNGASWQVLAPSVDDQSADWLSYPWTIPAEPSKECLVRLEGYFDATDAAVSPAVFEISAASSSDGGPPDRGCNCDSSAVPSGAALAVGCLVFIARRRRRRTARRVV